MARGRTANGRDVFRAIASPHRRRILDLLRVGELSVGDLSEQLDLSQASTSKHLRYLSDANLVEVRADGRHRWYRVTTEPLLAADVWLRSYRDEFTPDTPGPKTRRPPAEGVSGKRCSCLLT